MFGGYFRFRGEDELRGGWRGGGGSGDNGRSRGRSSSNISRGGRGDCGRGFVSRTDSSCLGVVSNNDLYSSLRHIHDLCNHFGLLAVQVRFDDSRAINVADNDLEGGGEKGAIRQIKRDREQQLG